MTLALFCCTLVPVSYHFYLQPSNSVKEYSPTQYQTINVDGPIQPIPKVIGIDEGWRDLGKALFHSPLLSKDNTIACSSCHSIAFGGDDGFSLSTGVGSHVGERNSPTVLNAVFNFRQFWDGREPNLARQIQGPIHNPVEMATSWPEIIEKLSKDAYFSATFSELSVEGISEQSIVKALVTFEESLVTPGAPIDRYLLGDTEALSSQQIRGLNKFINFGCTTCHQGKNIGGNFYQKLGRIDTIPEQLTQDLGKYLTSNDPGDRYVFKVPSLRNVEHTAPYFHNGAVNTLSEAVDIMAKSQLGMELSQEDNEDLVALLKSFSAPVQEGVAQ